MGISNAVCAFYPMSFKWMLQSSEQELGKLCCRHTCPCVCAPCHCRLQGTKCGQTWDT